MNHSLYYLHLLIFPEQCKHFLPLGVEGVAGFSSSSGTFLMCVMDETNRFFDVT